jgi:hypothetical protein
VVDLLYKYHKQSGKRLWDAKHEVEFNSLLSSSVSFRFLISDPIPFVHCFYLRKHLVIPIENEMKSIYFAKIMTRNMNFEFYEQIYKRDIAVYYNIVFIKEN